MLPTTKQCNTCNIIKSLSEFGNHKRMKDGLRSSCKKCEKITRTDSLRKKSGVVHAIYWHQVLHSKTRGHTAPEYTKQELKDWILRHPLFNGLYESWVTSNYNKDMKPSVDRKNDAIGYSIDNIQLMTWGENNKKARSDMRCGKLINGSKPHRKVKCFNLDGVFIEEFVSAQDASRRTGACQPNITKTCQGKRSQAGGLRWCYS